MAEEKLVMTMGKAQLRNKTSKIQRFGVFFPADISKSEEISRWRPIDKALHCDFSATKKFFKNRHNRLSEGLTFLPAMHGFNKKRNKAFTKIIAR